MKKIISEKAKYDMNLRKKLEKKQFNTDLSKDEFEKLNELLIRLGINKALFIRIAKNNLKEGKLKMNNCEEIKDYLRGKEISISYEEKEDFDLGNYPKQYQEDDITLNDGYLFYIENKDRTKSYISLSKRTNPDDTNDEYLDDQFFSGYFSSTTLDNLLNLVEKK